MVLCEVQWCTVEVDPTQLAKHVVGPTATFTGSAE